MRTPAPRLPILLTVALALLCLPTVATAQAAAPATVADTPAGEFQLHQTFKACGPKWAKRAAKLEPEKLEWMLRREHRLYRLAAAGRTLMTLELLSTASFRDCKLAEQWAVRETTVRVTYYFDDGATRTRLVHFADDDVFFDGQPRFYVGLGKALLRGVRQDGTAVSRWLELDLLPALIDGLRERQPTLVAALVPGTDAAAEAAAAGDPATGF